MKSLIVICVLIAAVFADEFAPKTKEDLDAARVFCVNSLSVPEAQVAEYRKWSFANDELTRCYISCMLNQLQLFDKDHGGINVPNLVAQLRGHDEREHLEDDIRACVDANPNGDDGCTWAFRQFTCLQNSHLSLIQLSVAH